MNTSQASLYITQKKTIFNNIINISIIMFITSASIMITMNTTITSTTTPITIHCQRAGGYKQKKRIIFHYIIFTEYKKEEYI